MTASILAVIAVILSGTVIALKLTNGANKTTPAITQEKPEGSEPVKTEESKPIEEEVLPEENVETKTEEPSEPAVTQEPVVEKVALEYVPKPGMILTYYHDYPSGEQGEEREITAKLDPEILVSKAIMLPDDLEPLLIYHFVEGVDGIYQVQNDNPEDSMLWLPNNPKIEDTWKDPYHEYKIMDMGVAIEVGGRTFENCIMRKNTNLLADFINISYIAPGYGEVYSVYQGGTLEFELTAEEADTFELGQDVMRDKIKFLDGILSYKYK